ncbi:hypothetical protein V8D89_002202 [Ganoderma adspersum]
MAHPVSATGQSESSAPANNRRVDRAVSQLTRTPSPANPTSTPPSPSPTGTQTQALSLSPAHASTSDSARKVATTITSPTSEQLCPAPFRNSQQPTSSHPSPHDYINKVKSLLTDAIGLFSLYLTIKQCELGMCAWHTACATQDTAVPYELSEHMIHVIISRKSTAHGDISDSICSAVVKAYGFPLVRDGAFHHKPTNTGKKSKFSEHSFITQALQTAFFSNVRNGARFVHKDHFDPIPDEALAFVHTVIHAHICEWSTGTPIKEDFSEAKNVPFYASFLKDIQKYGGGKNATAWANIRKCMYVKAFRVGSGLTLQVHTAQMSTAAMEAATAELAERTGLTDSEDEDEPEGGTA